MRFKAWQYVACGVLAGSALLMDSPAQAITARADAASRSVSLGTLRGSFTDSWSGTGMSTWTLTSSRSNVNWTQTRSGPVPGHTLSISDEICFSKYGFGGVSVSGGGLAPGGLGTETGCSSGSASSSWGQSSFTWDHGQVVGRGNPYGRWLWVRHSMAGTMCMGNCYDIYAYRRSSPIGGTV